MEPSENEKNSENSEGMYSYKSDNNNNNNNIENNNNINNNHIPGIESDAIRRSIADMNIEQNEKPDLNQVQKKYFPSGTFKDKENDIRGSIPYRSSQISIVIPPESPLHWSFIVLYIIIEVLLIILIGTLFDWDNRNHPNYSCLNFNLTEERKVGEGEETKIYMREFNETNELNIKDYIYLETENEINTYNGLFKDINIMAFVGFGMFHTLSKGNSWTSIVFNTLSIILSFQISLFFNLIFENAFKEYWKYGVLNFKTFIEAIFNSCTILVSLGGVLGKISHIQYLVLIICESILCSLNFKLCDAKLKIIDTGGGLYIHTFGAVFGFAIFIVLFRSKKKRLKLQNYDFDSLTNNLSRITCFIGVLFIINYFPSLNAGLALSDDGRYRAVINTYFSIIGSIICSFITSGFIKNGKFNYSHILFGSFSGGVIISGCCSVCLDHWAALLIGMLCGVLSVIFLEYLSKFFMQLGFYDIFNILIIHAIPGILGSFITSMFISDLERRLKETKIDYHWILLNSMERDNHAQAGIQIGGIFITLAISFVGGITVGFLIKVSRCGKIINYFDDNEFFSEGMNEVIVNNNITNIEDDNQPSFIK